MVLEVSVGVRREHTTVALNLLYLRKLNKTFIILNEINFIKWIFICNGRRMSKHAS